MISSPQRDVTFDESMLEADILSLADQAAVLGLSDLNEHTEGVNMFHWDIQRVRSELEQLARYGGHTAVAATDALARLDELP